jgi:hypothetical protein
VKVTLQVAGAVGAGQWKQYAVRFLLGGLVTLITGSIAKGFGPEVGGLFLAFPAIFPASATLIAKRERLKKARKGLHGTVRGRRAAALDAAGAVLGGAGLAGFAVTAYNSLPRGNAAATLGIATFIWLAVALPLWWLRKTRPWRRMRRWRHRDRQEPGAHSRHAGEAEGQRQPAAESPRPEYADGIHRSGSGEHPPGRSGRRR